VLCLNGNGGRSDEANISVLELGSHGNRLAVEPSRADGALGTPHEHECNWRRRRKRNSMESCFFLLSASTHCLAQLRTAENNEGRVSIVNK